jgi:hypothetical protein
MLVLSAFVNQGVIPLLGPKASVGPFHHGALEYFLLAPSAWLSGSQPLGVIVEMAVIGIAAVAATWWLGRVIGGPGHGPLVGLVGGLLLAVSPAAVDESIFIWNPNPVPLFAAVSVGAAWRARQTGMARWWALAIGAAAVVANLHILGAIFVVPIVALLAADFVRASRVSDWQRVRAARRGAVAGVVIAIAIYLPLVASELQNGFRETRLVLEYITGGGLGLAVGGSGGSPLGFMPRLLVIALRVLSWPFAGLITDTPVVSSLVVAVVVALIAWLVLRGREESGAAGRWLAASIAWSIVALAVAAPQLATVVTVLPNDHYHSFADPLILIAVALAGSELLRTAKEHINADSSLGRERNHRPVAARIVPALGVAMLGAGVALALARQPGPDPNGGWPGARAAGEHIVATVGRAASGGPGASGLSDDVGAAATSRDSGTGSGTTPHIAVVNLPDFEPATWISYPIVYASAAAGDPSPLTDDPMTGDYLVLGCDRAFEVRIGAACAGPADERWLPRLVGSLAPRLRLVERFDVSARISVSIYRVAAPSS